MGVEIDGDLRGASSNEIAPHVPGRDTLVIAEARRSAQMSNEQARGHDDADLFAGIRPERETASPGEGRLPVETIDRMERAYGQRFDDVEVHADSAEVPSGEQAFTRAQQIHLEPGVDLESPRGELVVAHELAHVVQQRGGGHRPGTRAQLEREAQHAALLASQGQIARITLRAESASSYAFSEESDRDSEAVDASTEAHSDDASHTDASDARKQADKKVSEGMSQSDLDGALGELITTRIPGGPRRARRDEVVSVVDRLAGALGLGRIDVHLGDAGRGRARAAGARGVMAEGAIYLDDQTFEPSLTDGRQLIAHEVAHVAQSRLAPPTGAAAGARAEREAHAFAAQFVATGALGALRAGLPSGHVAAEGEPGECAPELPELGAVDESPIDLAEPAALAKLDEGLRPIFAGIVAEPAFAALIDRVAGGEQDAALDPEGESDPAAPSPPPAAEAPSDPLAELRETDAFAALVDASALLMTETGEAIQDTLVQAFEGFPSTSCDPSQTDALAEVVAAANEAAAALGECSEDQLAAQTGFGALPADASVIYDFSRWRESEAAPPAPPPAAEPESCEPPVPELDEVCEVPAAAVSDVPPTMPAVGNVDGLGTVPASELDDIDVAVSFSSCVPEWGEALSTERVLHVLGVVKEGSLATFASNFVKQTMDSFALDVGGKFLDLGLKNVLLWAGNKGAAEVPVIGPAMVLAYDIYSAGSPDGWYKAQVATYFEATRQWRSVFPQLVSTWQLLHTEGADPNEIRAQVFKANADYWGGLAGFCDIAATTCGILSVASLVGAFGCTFFVATAAAAAPLLALAKVLGEACTVLGVIAGLAHGCEALFELLASFFLPIEKYGKQDEELKVVSQEFAEVASGFAGDAAGQGATELAHTLVQRIPPTGGAPSAPKADVGGGGEASAAATGDKVAADTARRTDAVETADAEASKATDPGPNAALARQLQDLAVKVLTRGLLWPGLLGPSLTKLQQAGSDLVAVVRSPAVLTQSDPTMQLMATARAVLAEQITTIEADLASTSQSIAEAKAASGSAATDEKPGAVQDFEAQHAALSAQLGAARSWLASIGPQMRELAVELEIKQKQATPSPDLAGAVHAPAQLGAVMVGRTIQIADPGNNTRTARVDSVNDLGVTATYEPASTTGAVNTTVAYASVVSNDPVASQAATDAAAAAAKQAEGAHQQVPSDPNGVLKDITRSPGSSSGEVSGGVGTDYKTVIEGLLKLNEETEEDEADADRAGQELELVLDAIDEYWCNESVEGQISPAAAQYWAEHGKVIADDLTYLSHEMPSKVMQLNQPPGADPAAIAECSAAAQESYETSLFEYASGYYLGELEASVVASLAEAPTSEQLGVLVDMAAGQETELTEALERNQAQREQVVAIEGGKPTEAIPTGIMQTVIEVQSMLGDTGDLPTGPSEVPDLSTDPAAAVEAGYRQLEGAGESLAADQTALTDLQAGATRARTEIETIAAECENTTAPIATAADEIAATKETQLAASTDHRSQAEADAGEASAGVSELQVYTAEQQALRDSLGETCEP